MAFGHKKSAKPDPVGASVAIAAQQHNAIADRVQLALSDLLAAQRETAAPAKPKPRGAK